MSTQANKFDSFFAEIPNVLHTLKVQDIGMYAPNVAGLLYDKIHTAYHGTNPPRSTTQFIDFETLPENWKSLVTRKFGLNLVKIISSTSRSHTNSNLPKNTSTKNTRKKL